jgi:hypothetical protein
MSVTDLGRATIDLVNQYRAQEIAKLAGSLPKSTQTQLAQALRLLAKPPTEHLSIEA